MSIRELREAVGLSQSALAEQSGYSLKTIQRWELGEGSPRKAVIEYLHALASKPRTEGGGREFEFIDLFAGIGGLRKGFDAVGGRCVFTSEIDKYAQRTYKANFGDDHPIAGDIVEVPSEAIPRHD